MDINETNKGNNQKIDETISILSALCVEAKTPMFLSIARPDKVKGISYDNRIIAASLEMPGYAKRINKLILAVNNCDLKLPEYIQRDIEELTRWLENEGVYYSDEYMQVDKFRDFLDVANGQVNAVVPHDLILNKDFDVEDVVTKKIEE